MKQYSLKDIINEHLPLIDKLLTDQNIPIFDRSMRAALIFIDVAVVDSNFKNKEELKSKAFFEGILPLVDEWYWNKYGQLIRNPIENIYSGIIDSYAQPVLIKIPAITSRIEVEGESAWLTFPDCLQPTESLQEMIGAVIDLAKLDNQEKINFEKEASHIISLTRSINLNIMSASRLDEEIRSMSIGIWSHFEKAVSDILSFQNERASIGCWELHLAIEKTFKVLLKQKSGNKEFGHDLVSLSNKAETYFPGIDKSLINELPRDKEAINLRYAEIVKTSYDAVIIYKKALKLVDLLTSNLDRDYRFNNASFLVKMVPWAR
jgi:hypothetical protein